MPMPTTASTTACVQKDEVETLASVIAMISAERMKSVLIAPAIFCSSSCARIERARRRRSSVVACAACGMTSSRIFSAPS